MPKQLKNLDGDKSVQKATEKTSSPNWQPSKEAKASAFKFRIFALISWFLAIASQLGVIWYVIKVGNSLNWFLAIGLILLDLVFAILGAYFWKRSNRLDPPSEKNKFLFFMQSQLGLFVAIIAFLPLVVFIFTNKNLDGKHKGILGTIAVVALLAAGLTSVDWHPVSKEGMAQQTELVQSLTGKDQVIGSPTGTKYHLFENCPYVSHRQEESQWFTGTIAQLHAKNSRIGTGTDSIDQWCLKKALTEKGWTPDRIAQAVSDAKANQPITGLD